MSCNNCEYHNRNAALIAVRRGLDCLRIYAICFLTVIVVPTYSAAQDSDSTEAGAELNIAPLVVDEEASRLEKNTDALPIRDVLPVPNKIGGRVQTLEQQELDDSWQDGESLIKQSLLPSRALDKDKNGLSQEGELLLSIQRSINNNRKDKIFIASYLPSLFFTARQHGLLREARAGFNLRAPARQEEEDKDNKDKGVSLSDLDLTLDDLGPEPLKQKGKGVSLSDLDLTLDDLGPEPSKQEDKASEQAQEDKVSQQPRKVRSNYIRKLVLNGIIYKEPGKWIVWLNDKRVTPEDKLEQIVDIKVRENFIELRWYDAFNEKIFPVRLRSGQRFNLDTRSFASAGSRDAS